MPRPTVRYRRVGRASRQGAGAQRHDVVTDTGSELGDDVGCRRRDEEQFAPAGDSDVGRFVILLSVPDALDHRSAGQAFKGDRPDEPGGGFGHDHPHLGPVLDDAADEDT